MSFRTKGRNLVFLTGLTGLTGYYENGTQMTQIERMNTDLGKQGYFDLKEKY
ncbi:MAG: hypothetical protein OEV42_16805 [Deltaproteobacteria bacterium]|nr:hypothetical protein [Deltaproteobacteria bacterium]